MLWEKVQGTSKMSPQPTECLHGGGCLVLWQTSEAALGVRACLSL